MGEVVSREGLHSGVGVAWQVLSDEDLAGRASKGDQRAFAAIYRRYYQRLFRFCLATVGNAQDAQDVLQNTMVKVLRALPGEERRIELKPWLYRIAHNESVDLMRRRHSAPQFDPGLPAATPEPVEAIVDRDRMRQLIADIGELLGRQRTALVMRELGNLSFAEIAVALDTSPAVVRQAVYEARLSLRRMAAGREMGCATVMRALSDADGRVTRRRDIRAHLRSCESCCRFREELDDRRKSFAAFPPLPIAAAAGLMRDVLGGTGAGGAGLAGALGGGAGGTFGASAIVKAVATVGAIVATAGFAATERSSSIDVVLGSADSKAPPPKLQPSSNASGEVAAAQPMPPIVRRVQHAIGVTHSPATQGASGESQPVHAEQGRQAPPAQEQPAESDAATTSTPSHAAEADDSNRGYAGSPPPAAAHGYQTAAARKAVSHGAGRDSPEHPGHSDHPANPPHPVNPGSAGKTDTPATPSYGSGSPHGPGEESPQVVSAPPSAEKAQQPSNSHGMGKKP